MNQNIFCSKCHRIPSQCCCSSAKELTDEEILDTARTMPTIEGATMEQAYVLFARAVLRKAQEKC
jgi:hypothetical protein